MYNLRENNFGNIKANINEKILYKYVKSADEFEKYNKTMYHWCIIYESFENVVPLMYNLREKNSGNIKEIKNEKIFQHYVQSAEEFERYEKTMYHWCIIYGRN